MKRKFPENAERPLFRKAENRGREKNFAKESELADAGIQLS